MDRDKTVLVTMGACGTYMMKDLIHPISLSSDIKNFNRHRRDPNIKGVDKVVYLYSNPYDTILSYHRRGFMTKNGAGHCYYIGGDCVFLNNNLNLNLINFLKLEYDPFKLKDHFLGYLNFQERGYDILFVKYEFLNKYIDTVLDWFGCDQIATKFQLKNRKSNYQNQPSEVQYFLKKTWGDLMDIQSDMPEAKIIKKKTK